ADVRACLRDGRRTSERVAWVVGGRQALPDGGGGSQPGDHYAPCVQKRDTEEPPGAPRSWCRLDAWLGRDPGAHGAVVVGYSDVESPWDGLRSDVFCYFACG